MKTIRIGCSDTLLALIAGALLVVAARGADQRITPEEGALRAAVAQGGIITFTRGGAITLRQPITVTGEATIDATAAPLVLSGGNASRLLNVAPGGSLTLVNVTLANGRAATGGAVFNEGFARLIDCIVTDNAAEGSDGNGESAEGGAIRNTGVLVLSGTTFNGNRATGSSGNAGARGADGYASAGRGGDGGSGGHALGGAVYSSGQLDVTNCVFSNNRAAAADGGAGGAGGVDAASSGAARAAAGGAGGNGGDAMGGAIFFTGAANLVDVRCTDNVAAAGNGGAGGASGGDATTSYSGDAGNAGRGGDAAGGGVASEGATVAIIRGVFSGNSVSGGDGGASTRAAPAIALGNNGSGGAGGNGLGAAIHLSGGGATIEQCSIARNTAAGGQGTAGADCFNQPVGRFLPTPGGSGGAGGWANGTLFSSGDLLVTGCALNGNVLRGGNGGNGGNGGSARTVRGSSGGNGGDGGLASGAGICSRGSSTVINCTIVDNECNAGVGGNGGVSGQAKFSNEVVPGGNGGIGGLAAGAGVCADASGRTTLDFVTLANNAVYSGRGGSGGRGSSSIPGGSIPNGTDAPDGRAEGANVAGLGTGGVELRNSISALARPVATQAAGAVFDSGHNVCSDSSCGFTDSSSLNDTDPMLVALDDNGGSTMTMALRTGSPCIDSASAADAPTTDQRGYGRPSGAAPDIGAFESAAAPAGIPGQGFVIRGRVLDGDAGLPGVKIKLGRQVVYTDENGEFTLVVKKKGRYAIRPVAPRTRFAPLVRRAVVRGQDVVLSDFVVKRRR